MPSITVKKLIDQLQIHGDNDVVIFGDNDLEFSRVKPRGPKLVQIEFTQLIYRESEQAVRVVDPE